MGWDKKVDAETKMTFMLKLDKNKVMKKLLDIDQAGDFMATNKERTVDDLDFTALDYVPDKTYSAYPCDDMNETGPSSSFIISNDMSHLSSNLDRWMINNSEETGMQDGSQVLSSAELFLSNIATVVGRARANVARIAQQQMTRDCFAMAMDIVLVVYAFGFLLLSLYQASIIG